MNGKVAKRIRRALWTAYEGGNQSLNSVEKRLKREYKKLPYHRRNLSHYGLTSLSHKLQHKRWMNRHGTL